MKDLVGKNVLITGGASGIGKLMTKIMLERQAHVVIWDYSQENINRTKVELGNNHDISYYLVDVSNIEQVTQMAKRVKSEVGIIDVLINNAGIVVGKYFHEHSVEDIKRTMDINACAPMYISRIFLPDMMAQNSGHLCNIASSAGLISNPKMSVYAASKWSLVGWSDSVRLEMEQLQKNIHVTTIMPYYINTGMFDGVKSKIPILEPVATAKTIIRAIERNKRMVTIPGYIYHATRLGQGLFPLSVFDFFADKVLGIYDTMKGFTGRSKK